MLTLRTTAVTETKQFAAEVCRCCEAGDLLLLVGDLGAGKTAFAQGFGQALGVEGPITSPTFTLANEYRGRLRLHHLDVYRLETLDEVFDLAIPELLDDEAITLIEWGDNITAALPNSYLEIYFGYGEADDDRMISMRCVGPSWTARARSLAEVAETWAEDKC